LKRAVDQGEIVMFRSDLMRGACAGALSLALAWPAGAQQSLPNIDIGASRHPTHRAKPQARAPGVQRTAPLQPAAAPQAAPGTPATLTSGEIAFDNPSYDVPNASSATKTDTPIAVTPASIQVIPHAVIEDRKATTVAETLQNVSGVQFEPAFGGNVVFNIRGFRTFNIFRNALHIGPGSFPILSLGPLDTTNIETIEVLKGPSAMLYGRGDPGGMIAITTKRPLDTPHYSFEQQIGSYDHFRTIVDATGPIDPNKTLLYRFTGSFQSNNSFRDFDSAKGFHLAGALTWRPSDATEITYDVEFTTDHSKVDTGVVAFAGRPVPVPGNRSFGDPNLPYSRYVTLYNGVNIKQKLYESGDTKWTFNGRFLARNFKDDDIALEPQSSFAYLAAFDPNTGLLQRNVFAQSYHERSYAGNADLNGKFETLGVKHDFLVGYDRNSLTGDYRTYGNGIVGDPDLTINIWAPSYGVPWAKFDPSSLQNSCLLVAGCQPSRLKQQNSGFYAQDHITLFDRLHLIGGARWDYAVSGFGTMDVLENLPTVIEQIYVPRNGEHGFSPRAGALFEATPWLGLFADWSRSFGVNNGVDVNKNHLPPEIGEQWEAGVKARFFDDRLAATLAFYQLTKTNIQTADLSGLNTSTTGNVRSRGIELDVSGRINDHISVIGNYTFTQTKILKLSDFNSDFGVYVDVAGNRWPNVPPHSASIWAKYDWNGYLAKEGPNFALGLRYVDTRQGDNQNTFQLPAYAVLDAAIGYKWAYEGTNWNAQVNFKNLTDAKYYQASDQFTNLDPRLGIYPGQRFQVVGSIKVEF
jgi:iron complex outermembrane recepter protein